MECRTCSDSLTAFIDDELDHDLADAVETHLNQCSNCLEEYHSLLYVYELADRVTSLELDPSLWSKIHSEITPGRFQRWWRTLESGPLSSLRWAPLAGALGIVFVSLVSVSLLVVQQQDAEVEKAFEAYLQERERMEIRWIHLPSYSPQLGTQASYPNPFRTVPHVPHENPFRVE